MRYRAKQQQNGVFAVQNIWLIKTADENQELFEVGKFNAGVWQNDSYHSHIEDAQERLYDLNFGTEEDENEAGEVSEFLY